MRARQPLEVQTGEGRLEFLVAESDSVPGPIREILYTNSRYRFGVGAQALIKDRNYAALDQMGLEHLMGR